MQFWQLFKRSARQTQSAKSITQPIPNVTLDDIDRVVRRDFPAHSFDEVMKLVEQYGAEVSQAGVARVRLAALKLATGDVGKLRFHIEAAKRDYRDVLAAAEYPGYMRTPDSWKLASDERRGIIENDWHQYDEWLRRSE